MVLFLLYKYSSRIARCRFNICFETHSVQKRTMTSTPTLDSHQESRADRDEDLILTLPSGRTIGYSRYGSSESKYPTSIYLHGYPSSRLEAAIYSKSLLSYGLQVVSLDRPGFGLSTSIDKPLDQRTILDHVEDIQALADHLNLDKFYILGISGGAPYAFACAHQIPHRLLGIGVVSGFGPWEYAASKEIWPKLWWLNKMGLVLPVKMPWLYQKLYGLLVPILVKKMSSATWEQVSSSSKFQKMADKSEDVRLVLEGGEEFYYDGIRSTQEAIRQKDFARCHVEEARLLAKPWPFSLGDISIPNLKFWYGTKDINTPPELGDMIHKAMNATNASMTKIENGTHASVIAKGPEFLRELIGLQNEIQD